MCEYLPKKSCVCVCFETRVIWFLCSVETMNTKDFINGKGSYSLCFLPERNVDLIKLGKQLICWFQIDNQLVCLPYYDTSSTLIYRDLELVRVALYGWDFVLIRTGFNFFELTNNILVAINEAQGTQQPHKSGQWISGLGSG